MLPHIPIKYLHLFVVVVAYVLRADILQEVITLQHDRVVASGLRWRERNLRPVGHGHV